ncbi:MAG TPA: DEAD/DEAH box helicase family protein [Allocoleopsis sp.]
MDTSTSKLNFDQKFETFQNNVTKFYSRYKWPKITNENLCIDSKSKRKFQLNNTQSFVTDYFNLNSPNGLFLFHSVGAGKTLSGVSIVSKFEKLGFHTLWVTRTTLKQDISKALEFIPLKKTLTVISYKQFSNIAKKRGELYKKLSNRTGSVDPLKKTILVIDEAHKLYTKDLKPQEMHDIKSIENMIFSSYSNDLVNRPRIVLMSATPITENPMEFILLLNLIITNKENRFELDTFKDTYLTSEGKFKRDRITDFKEKIKGLISYIDFKNDTRKFASASLTEIFVPIGSPKYNIANQTKEFCAKKYKACRETFGGSVIDCKKDQKKCLENIKQNKKDYKSKNYQNKILHEKCSV